jgi:hypothetical protein
MGAPGKLVVDMGQIGLELVFTQKLLVGNSSSFVQPSRSRTLFFREVPSGGGKDN